MNRTMIENDLNLVSIAGPLAGLTALTGVVAVAEARPHLRDAIRTIAWQRREDGPGRVVVTTTDAGQAVHLANALGFSAGTRGAAFLLPRTGEISGVRVIVDTDQS